MNTTTAHTPKIQSLLAAIQQDAGWVNAEWANTGGGCYAIRVDMGDYTQADYSGLLITGDDVFIESDFDSDDNLDGHWFVGAYNPAGDLIGMQGTRDQNTWAETLTLILANVEAMAEVVTRLQSGLCIFCGEGDSAEAGPVENGFHRDSYCQMHHENEQEQPA